MIEQDWNCHPKLPFLSALVFRFETILLRKALRHLVESGILRIVHSDILYKTQSIDPYLTDDFHRACGSWYS